MRHAVSIVKQHNMRQNSLLVRDITSSSLMPSMENEERIMEIYRGLTSIEAIDVHEEDSKLDVQLILRQCHQAEYIDMIQLQSSIVPEGDVLFVEHMSEPGVKQDTPIVEGIYDTAISAFRVSVQAARLLQEQGYQCVYALCRPPGHHAGKNWMGGYSYFNNAAAAGMVLRRNGYRTGIIDLDFHYANGTASILSNEHDIFFGSIHGSTEFNFPYKLAESKQEHHVYVSFQTSPAPQQYIQHVRQIIDEALVFGCTALVVSIGYDIIAHDPHGKWDLKADIFREIGALLKFIAIPICFVQEGGYGVGQLYHCARNLMMGYIQGGDVVGHEIGSV